MRKQVKELSPILLNCLVVIMIFTLAYNLKSTYSALVDNDNENNDFRVGNLKVSVDETFIPPDKFEPDKTYEKKVSITNQGDMETFIRVLSSPIISVVDEDGSVIILPSDTSGENSVLSVDYNLTDWVDGNDGYFYYKKKLRKNENTTMLFTTVRMNKKNISEEYLNAKLEFEIKAEAIHTTKFAYREAWWKGIVPDSASPLKEIDELLRMQTID